MAIPSESPLRILRVVHTLRREAGGPSESVLRSTQALQQLGHHIEVATADPNGTHAPAETSFPFHTLGSFGPNTLGVWLHREHTRFDAVLVHGLWQAGWTVRQTLRATGTPYLVFPHGMLDPWFKRAYPFKHVKKQVHWWLREGRVLRDAAAVCFTCEEERQLGHHTFFPYQANEKVVAYGTAAPPPDHAAMRAAFAQRFPAFAHRPFILFLGRLHAKKGLRELISGYAAFRQATPSAPLLAIAGPCADPKFQQELEGLAATSGLASLDLRTATVAANTVGDVIWLPMLADSHKWGALFSSEAFILPSHQENFGIAVAEALACGRPVLISDKVNIWREITNFGAGLVATDTPSGVLDLLSRWATIDQAARIAMSQAAQACFTRNFEISNAAQSLADTVRNCLRR